MVEVWGTLGVLVHGAPIRSLIARYSPHCRNSETLQLSSIFVNLGHPKFRGGGSPLGLIRQNGIIYISLSMNAISTEFFLFNVQISPLSVPKFWNG
jgi:hypothetical protein